MLKYSWVLLSLSLFVTTAFATENAELVRMRDSLPDKALTVDLILSRSLQTSNRFRQVRSEFYKIPVSEQQAQSAFDTRLELSHGRLRDDNESSYAQSPNQTHADQSSLGLTKYFSTGTGIRLEASQGYNDIGFQAFTLAPYYQTKTSIGLEQKLWADSFGYASRRGLHAARLASEAQKYNFQSSVEQWALGIIDTFYLAWYSQAQAVAAREGLKRRERLLQSTKIRLNRGTAETPDYLQVESAFLLSKAQKLEAEKNLDDQWRRLIILLKLPAEWLEIDAVDVPIKIDNVVTLGAETCRSFRQKGIPATESAQVLSATKMYESSVLQYEKVRNERWPDLKLAGRYFTNGIDNRAGESSTEAFDRDHPGWSVGLTLSLPLEFNLQKANIQQAAADKMRFEAIKNDVRDNRTLDWLNECANLERLQVTLIDAEKSFRNQNRRADLEERRFRLGRSNTVNVIQAGDDATQAEIFLRSIEVQIRQSAWKILHLNSQILDEIKKFAQKHGGNFNIENP